MRHSPRTEANNIIACNGCNGWLPGPKIAFLAQKGPFWAISARKRPAEQPNGHLPENRRYPELPQDMGKL